jgi:hypothetical protein
MKHWGMSPTVITNATRKVQRNRNAPRDYAYTESGKEKVTLEHSYILRELLIALHMP